MGDAPRFAGDSALVVPIPEADPLIGAIRRRHDPAARAGVPAHVTILFPFVPSGEVDHALRAALRDHFAAIEAFAYRFTRVERFDERTVYLVPEPAPAFSSLIESAASRWPDYPPYGGQIQEVVPHLTLGVDLAPGVADEVTADAETALERHGPVRGRAGQVALIISTAGQWSTDGTFALGRSPY